ncbi:hypothetical protein Tco_0332419 [Tanacetum coccineum]
MLKDNTLILGNVPSNQNMNKDSMARLAEASAAEAMAANGMWEAAQAHVANPAQTGAEINTNGGLLPGDDWKLDASSINFLPV